jgi:hypothetical protein
METDPVSETSCFYSLEYRKMEKVQKTLILCVIHHRQNLLESISWPAERLSVSQETVCSTEL